MPPGTLQPDAIMQRHPCIARRHVSRPFEQLQRLAGFVQIHLAQGEQPQRVRRFRLRRKQRLGTCVIAGAVELLRLLCLAPNGSWRPSKASPPGPDSPIFLHLLQIVHQKPRATVIAKIVGLAKILLRRADFSLPWRQRLI
jgi:hypothetical protein